MANTLSHVQKAETALGHEFNPEALKPADPPKEYSVPDFGIDKDIADSHQSLANAEADLDHEWNLAQLDSDPICSSSGCTQYKHKKTPRGYPIDYPVPDHGSDPDMDATQRSIAIGEASHSHKLVMGTPESKAKWHNVAKDTQYNFAPDLDHEIVSTQKHLGDTETKLQHKWVIEDVQLESDPICSSAGCTQYKHKKTPLGYPIDYPVVDNGADPDITSVANAIKIAENVHSHKLIMGTPESKAKWHNKAKDTLYNFAPDLDEDITSTQAHLGATETKLQHKWVIED